MTILYQPAKRKPQDSFAALVRLYANFQQGFINEINGTTAGASSGATRITATGPKGDQEFVLNMSSRSDTLAFPASETVTGHNSVPFTFECWMNKTGDGTVYNNTNYVPYGTLGLSIATNRISIYTGGGGSSWFNFTPFPNNVWTHFAVVQAQGGGFTVFVNGSIVGSTRISAPVTTDSHWRLGGFGASAGGGFTGRISRVRLTAAARYSAPFTP